MNSKQLTILAALDHSNYSALVEHVTSIDMHLDEALATPGVEQVLNPQELAILQNASVRLGKIAAKFRKANDRTVAAYAKARQEPYEHRGETSHTKWVQQKKYELAHLEERLGTARLDEAEAERKRIRAQVRSARAHLRTQLVKAENEGRFEQPYTETAFSEAVREEHADLFAQMGSYRRGYKMNNGKWEETTKDEPKRHLADGMKQHAAADAFVGMYQELYGDLAGGSSIASYYYKGPRLPRIGLQVRTSMPMNAMKNAQQQRDNAYRRLQLYQMGCGFGSMDTDEAYEMLVALGYDWGGCSKSL